MQARNLDPVACMTPVLANNRNSLHGQHLQHTLQAANPELSMAQIQQLTALAFARDESESAAQIALVPAASPSAAAQQPHNLSQVPSHAAAADVPSEALSERIRQIETSALSDLAGMNGTLDANDELGTDSAAAAAQTSDARGDGSDNSDWATAFIAEARQAADAAQSVVQAPVAGMAAPAADQEAAAAAASGELCIISCQYLQRQPGFQQVCKA